MPKQMLHILQHQAEAFCFPARQVDTAQRNSAARRCFKHFEDVLKMSLLSQKRRPF